MVGVLDGFRVLEVATWVAAPSAAVMLADWGAEVIKVEAPEGGDGLRGLVSVEGVVAGDVWWHQLNRGKKSVAIDLRMEAGQEACHRLAARCDVFLTNLSTRALTGLRLDYPTLRSINPSLVYGHLTGYGAEGPDRDLPGYDYSAFWARSGIMDRVSEPGRPPRANRPGFGDNTTSMAIAAGLLGALLRRERSGEGQEVRFSLYHTAVWALGMDVQTALSVGQAIPQNDPPRARNPLWNTYQTQDGRWVQLVMLQPDRYWGPFCQAIGQPHLEHDPRFATMEAREQNCRELVGIIASVLRTRPLAEWEQVFRSHDLVFGRVQTVLETVVDEQAWANEFFTEVQGNDGPLRLVNSPIRYMQTPSQVRAPGPELGQHTEEVLLDLAGYTWEELERLKSHGVIPW